MAPGDRVNSVEVEIKNDLLVYAESKRPRVSIDIQPSWFEGRVVNYGVTIEERVTSNEVGRIELTPFRSGFKDVPPDRLHLYHLEVPEQFRNMGFGTVLFNVFKEYALESTAKSASIRVGNGGTEDFLKKVGVKEQYIHVHQFPNADERSVVVTTQSDMGRVRDAQSMTDTAERIEGVYVDRLFE